MSKNIVDKLAWWIPIKSLRNKFREDVKNYAIEECKKDFKKSIINEYRIDIQNSVMEQYNLYENDKSYLHGDCPIVEEDQYSYLNKQFENIKNKKDVRVLEIGSRVVTRNGKLVFPGMDYVGFDYLPGENVDVVGDAHNLSSYFKEDEKFDIVVSVAVFEHLAMPWKVAEEIYKVLKPGGFVYIITHFAWSSHERPWHFFHYTDMGLKVLFSEALGFECIKAGFSCPIVARFSSLVTQDAWRYNRVSGLYGIVQYLGRKMNDKNDFDWNKMSVDKLVPNTSYPEGSCYM